MCGVYNQKGSPGGNEFMQGLMGAMPDLKAFEGLGKKKEMPRTNVNLFNSSSHQPQRTSAPLYAGGGTAAGMLRQKINSANTRTS